ncbi:nucleotidyltransferase domain-containing protein [Hydrogenophaga sp.]|uniref:nucleotidyltransferase domain-containing protein n=2 Tax=Hydrogenophaga sp. TaxID=1904254 RepID=UPI00169CE6CF|nr:nucleotidyltransferase domain-containing protein [Hydrogenophaga sp.]NIN29094.1 MarR family transcriptional regulator [Hydrogenophaga sp.]NIT00020.1 MarR family transcriptional regulator [Hydrogenophaga sp.]
MNTVLMSELLGGASRYQALRRLYENPERRFRVRELASEAGVDPGNASRWLRRWAEVGLLDASTERGQTIYSASSDPALQSLRTLLQQDSETARLVREALERFEDPVAAAAIFGSTARGEASASSDVDLLMIADGTSRLKAQAHFKNVGRQLARPVNVLLYTPNEWRKAREAGDTLVRDILSQDLIALKGDIHALA